MSQPKIITFGVASKTSPKSEGLQLALQYLSASPSDYSILTSLAKSKVHEQPAGVDEGDRGVRNRMISAETLFDEQGVEPDYIISAENYIVPETDQYNAKPLGSELNEEDIGNKFIPEFYLDEDWYDLAIVGIKPLGSRIMSFAHSDKVIFPAAAVKATWEKGPNNRDGFTQYTVGKTLQEMGIVQDHQDPHVDLPGLSGIEKITNQSRTIYLRDAYITLLKKVGF